MMFLSYYFNDYFTLLTLVVMAGIGCHELMKPYDMTLLPRRLIIYYINQWEFRPFSLDNLVSRLNFNFRLFNIPC